MATYRQPHPSRCRCRRCGAPRYPRCPAWYCSRFSSACWPSVHPQHAAHASEGACHSELDHRSELHHRCIRRIRPADIQYCFRHRQGRMKKPRQAVSVVSASTTTISRDSKHPEQQQQNNQKYDKQEVMSRNSANIIRSAI